MTFTSTQRNSRFFYQCICDFFYYLYIKYLMFVWIKNDGVIKFYHNSNILLCYVMILSIVSHYLLLTDFIIFLFWRFSFSWEIIVGRYTMWWEYFECFDFWICNRIYNVYIWLKSLSFDWEEKNVLGENL